MGRGVGAPERPRRDRAEDDVERAALLTGLTPPCAVVGRYPHRLQRDERFSRIGSPGANENTTADLCLRQRDLRGLEPVTVSCP